MQSNYREQLLLHGFQLIEFDAIESTNDEAKKLAKAGAVDGTCVWAHTQYVGRGSRGRKWESLDGNLFVSFIVRPKCKVTRISELTFVTAIAVHTLVSEYLPKNDDVKCKWPNDILVSKKKISGILLESSTIGRSELEWLVIGVGINLINYPDIAVAYPPTSLDDEGAVGIDSGSVLVDFAKIFRKIYQLWQRDGFEAIRENWSRVAYRLGDRAILSIGNNTYEGLFMGINDVGALCLRLDTGMEMQFTAGDLTFVE